MLDFFVKVVSDSSTNYPSSKRLAYIMVMFVVAMSLAGLAGTIIGISIKAGVSAFPTLLNAFEFLTLSALGSVTTGYILGKRNESLGGKESASNNP